jgi:hypothetical protein
VVARAFFESIKTLAFGSISASYAAVGSPTTHTVKAFCISNNTQGDMYFTVDNTQDSMFLAAGSFRLYDVQANMNSQFDDKFVFPIGTQFYVKQITAPVSGNVYVEVIY